VSETPKKLMLDAVLREWPENEKSPLQWEEMALRIDERVRSGAPAATAAAVSDENLFAAPLGQIEGEGHNSAAISAPVKAGETRVSKGETMTMPADRERDRRSLQDLAKMAATGMTPPPPSVRAPHSSGASGASAASAPSGVQRAAEAKKDDSGIVDLAMAAQSDPNAAVRAQSTPLAKDGLFDDEPASVRPGPVSSGAVGALSGVAQAPVSHQYQQPAPSMPPFSALHSTPPSPASLPPGSISQPLSAPVFAPAVHGSAVASSSQQAIAPAHAQKKSNGKVIALLLGGLVAVSSMAAGGFFFMKHRAAEQLAKSTPVVTQPVVAADPPPAKPVEVANAAPATDPSVDPNALPTPAPDTKVAVAPKVAAKGGVPAAAVAKNDKPAPVKEEGPKLSAKDLPTTPTGPGGDLGSAMGKAVGADGKSADPTPAAGNTGPQFAAGTVPQKPSQGAVTGAIGAVLPGARACLGPDDPVSRASITFTSAGTVQNVSVTGGAAGKPAEGCIKGALGKAKVAPFAEATYTANITVRH
jgi:hypothetical protein